MRNHCLNIKTELVKGLPIGSILRIYLGEDKVEALRAPPKVFTIVGVDIDREYSVLHVEEI